MNNFPNIPKTAVQRMLFVCNDTVHISLNWKKGGGGGRKVGEREEKTKEDRGKKKLTIKWHPRHKPNKPWH